MASWYTMHKTRFPELGFCNLGAGLWRLVDLSDDPEGEKCSVVGPQYKSKAELLADLNRYNDERNGAGRRGEIANFGTDTAESIAGAMLDHFGLDGTIEAIRNCASFQERQAVGTASDQWTRVKNRLTEYLQWFRDSNLDQIS